MAVSLDQLAAAIARVETGASLPLFDPARYAKRNRVTGARGKYQIMPRNWPGWCAEAGLPRDAPWTPANQERVARHKLGNYLARWGALGAAAAWHGGPGAVTNPARHYGPRTRCYVREVRERLGPAAGDATGIPAGFPTGTPTPLGCSPALLALLVAAAALAGGLVGPR